MLTNNSKTNKNVRYGNKVELKKSNIDVKKSTYFLCSCCETKNKV